MLVNLSRHSWHSKYYNFVKGHYPTYDFKSLCPYFWTIVSYILLSPVIIFWKVFKALTVKPIQKAIYRGVDKSLSEPYKRKGPNKFWKWWDKNEPNIDKWGQRIYFGFLISVVLFIIIAGLVQLFKEKGVWLSFIYIFAWIGAATTIVFVSWGVVSFFDTDIWRAIKGMSYSVKNKVCPMIEWD